MSKKKEALLKRVLELEKRPRQRNDIETSEQKSGFKIWNWEGNKMIY